MPVYLTAYIVGFPSFASSVMRLERTHDSDTALQYSSTAVEIDAMKYDQNGRGSGKNNLDFFS